MSLTIFVPASVPSLFHSSSAPCRDAGVDAAKKSLPPTLVRLCGRTGARKRTMNPPPVTTFFVPVAVPSLFHSSECSPPSYPWKKSVPSTFAGSDTAPWWNSFSSCVPVEVPSLAQSSSPLKTPAALAKKSLSPPFVRKLG